ncbi:MAG: TonB-dependent receptor, partial [Bacteroidota bacterium]
IRALQAVPGIQSFGDGSALYYVRGGNSDQNLLVIDEVPVYNPSHLFGFFSAFAPDAINEVQVYKGDFPAKYGGRLSSVIDIKAKEGNLKQFGFSGNMGPYASTVTFEGPVIKNRASFFISGRLSTLNWLTRFTALQKTFNFQFFDINAKLNFKLNENNRFFFTCYTGRDDFSHYASAEINTYGINWNNLAGTFRWNHLFNGRFFSNTTLSYSRYNYSLTLPREQNGYWKSSISNLTLKSDMTWYLNPDNTLRAGWEVTNHESNPGNVTLNDEVSQGDVPEISPYYAMEYVFYLSNEQKIGEKFSLRYGIRLPLWQDFGPATVYSFDENHRVIDTLHYGNLETYALYFNPEPRVNIQYLINAESSVKLSYCRTTQFLQLLSNSTSPFNSLEVWAAAGPNIPPQKADQLAIGYYRELFKSKWTVSVEGYYKWFHDHLDYRDHANMLFNPFIEGELRFGTAQSYGIELMLRKPTGKLTGWIGYTWSRALVSTPGVNNGESYSASYDRPNDFSINIAYDTRKHWSFYANWIFMTGAATTTPIGFYYNNGYSIPLYGGKNNDRLPDYHRLDLSVRYLFSKPGNRYQHSLALTLYNAYGRMNPFSVSYNKMMNDSGDFVVPSTLNGNYKLIPTSISVAGIIPSINYQFRF